MFKQSKDDDSSKIESEIKLLTQFSKMIEIANARYRPIVSEKVIEGLFQNKIVTENDFKDRESIQKLSQKLQQSVFIPPVGLATQKAAIGSVYTLGKEHSILREAAIEGLIEVKESFIHANFDYEFITKFIDELKKQSEKKQ